MRLITRLNHSVVMAGMLIITGTLLSACKQQAPETTTVEEPGSAAPDAKPGLALTGGRLVLPAVKGNPGAAYFTLANTGDKSVELVAVSVTGSGNAEIHKTDAGSMLPLKKINVGTLDSVTFAPGGLHVMVFDINDTVQAGKTAEVTLTFAGGDKVSGQLAVEATGSGSGDHGGMH